MKPKVQRPRNPSISCPHCQSRSIVRHSEQETNLSRELRLRCDNDLCGHTFVAQIVVIRTLTPSQMPNPEVNLPFCNPNLQHFKKPRPANDDHRTAGNDQHDPGPEAANCP